MKTETMKPLFLIGYMGCGKSSLARKIARRMGVRQVDTDDMVEQSEGASVVDIFKYEGEEHFRHAERAILDSIIDGALASVVSVGGGLPTWRDNMERMNDSGVTVYMKRPARQIASRLSPYGLKKRPRLRGLEGEALVEFMTSDMAAREPYYMKSQIVIDCTSLTDDQLLERILCETDNL